MPSLTSSLRPQSIHRSSMHYDHSVQLLGASFSTLVAISEEQGDGYEEDDDDSCNNSLSSITRYNNTKLRRDSFGNQSYKTGLSQLVPCEHDQIYTMTDVPTRTLLQRCNQYSTLTSSPGHHHDERTTTNTTATGWGYFIDE